jgi:hypothetical protein
VLDGFPPVLAKPVDSSPTAPSDIRKVQRPRLQPVIYNIAQFFCASGFVRFIIHDDYIIDHDYLDHSYYMIGYLDINIRLRLQLLIGNNSSQQRPPRHLRPRHSRCDCGRE